jgi:hypothetical protein
LTREELFGSRSVPNLQVLRKHLFEEGRLEIDLAREILAKGKALFAACSNVLELTGPLASTPRSSICCIDVPMLLQV